MKYKFSEALFASFVKWGYSILPDYGDSQRRQNMSNPFADSTLLLWWVQVILTSTSGASAYSMFLESLSPVCLW